MSGMWDDPAYMVELPQELPRHDRARARRRRTARARPRLSASDVRHQRLRDRDEAEEEVEERVRLAIEASVARRGGRRRPLQGGLQPTTHGDEPERHLQETVPV